MTVEYLDLYKTYVFVYSKTKQYHKIHLKSGIYQFECWGAAGGLSSEATDGYGAYTSGIITIRAPTTLYVVLGEEGTYSANEKVTHSRTFNGGGAGGIQFSQNGYGAGSGGGATDIRLIYNGNWSDFESLKSRIMVAAGGSGITRYLGYYGIDHSFGASGGTLNGLPGDFYDKVDGITVSTGATQNEGGKGCRGTYSNGENGQFGIGGDWGKTHCSSGGGGGYFGGGGGGVHPDSHCSGSSGSSYISGYPGCHSIKKDAKYEKPETENNPIHYSNYYFKNGIMIDGNSEMPSLTASIQQHQPGPGAVRIHYIGLPVTCMKRIICLIPFIFTVLIFIKKY